MKTTKRMKRVEGDLFQYNWTYYPLDKIGYLTLKNGKVSDTLPLVEGKVFMDRDDKGNVLGVEIIL